jgi:hypothetical protein
MTHKPSNQVGNHNENWKRERQREMEFYNSQPFFGGPTGEKFYNLVKQAIPSVVQASACGGVVGIVVYKKDADAAASILAKMFNVSVKRSESIYTGLITCSVVLFSKK